MNRIVGRYAVPAACSNAPTYSALMQSCAVMVTRIVRTTLQMRRIVLQDIQTDHTVPPTNSHATTRCALILRKCAMELTIVRMDQMKRHLSAMHTTAPRPISFNAAKYTNASIQSSSAMVHGIVRLEQTKIPLCVTARVDLMSFNVAMASAFQGRCNAMVQTTVEMDLTKACVLKPTAPCAARLVLQRPMERASSVRALRVTRSTQRTPDNAQILTNVSRCPITGVHRHV
jgi:hypothetical protein